MTSASNSLRNLISVKGAFMWAVVRIPHDLTGHPPRRPPLPADPGADQRARSRAARDRFPDHRPPRPRVRHINAATVQFSSVNAGYYNTASGYGATVAGGAENTASGQYAVVGGGGGNSA